jgi:TIR domain-containing protein
MATQIFICYRRDDSAGYTGRIQDRIKRDLGDVLFVDVYTVPLGVNFVKFLHEAVARCAVLIAVIGSRWLDAQDEDGKRRLDNPNDFVRIEIGAALQRNIPVIPILLDGIKMPRANQLPNDLEELAVRNALDVHQASFHSDMDRLIGELKAQIAEAAVAGPHSRWARFFLTQPTLSLRKRIFKVLFWLCFAMAMFAVLLLGASFAGFPEENPWIFVGSFFYFFGLALLFRLWARQRPRAHQVPTS